MKKLIKNWKIILFFLLILFFYWANTFHTNFPDEFDNIVGGWYITRGILPYVGFFSHHNPGAYYIASLIVLFTKQSFVAFRMIWAIVLFFTTLGSYIFLRKKFGDTKTRFFLLYTFLLGTGATYFWAHMILSETIVGYALIPTYGLILLKVYTQKRYTLLDAIFISLTTSVVMLTSFTFIFAVGALVGFFVYKYLSKESIKKIVVAAFKLVVIFSVPYILFLLYLGATGSFSEFVYDSITYNRDYYIYNFPQVAGQVSKHPVRYALSIFKETSHQFYALLTQVLQFNFSYPVNITLLLGNIGLLIILFLRGHYLFAGVVYIFLIYLNSRAEPLNSQETDFHSTVYFMTSIFNLSYVLFVMRKILKEKIEPAQELLIKVFLVVMTTYGFFTGLLFMHKWTDKAYSKFMGQMPAIYDAPVVAPIINKIVSKDEYYWIGPFEFQEQLYINGELPSKYHWFLPANERSEKIRIEIVADLINNRPKLIVFKEDLMYFGTQPKDYNYPIVNVLREYYFRLEDLEKEGRHFQPTITGLHNFDVAVNFYYDKRRKEEIIQQLLDIGLIELTNK